MPELEVEHLLSSQSLAVRHVRCAGTCSHRSAEECASATHLVFPYRGVYVRHVGRQQAIADANHVLFFNATEGYRVSHPLRGGDRSLVVQLSEDLLRELAPAQMLTSSGAWRFARQHQRIDAEAQALVMLLHHRLANGTLDGLAAETLSLALISRSLGPRMPHEPRATPARRRLVDRVKLLLVGDLSRRWRLAEIGAEIGSSPVYLTQLFQQIEGLPLYRYHLRLRLARALELVPHHEDLTALALELGFSSHAHFTSTFRQVYGRTPSQFKRVASR
ncbi:MAG: helix-turn-helix transcriptional regulator [Terriglobales bacterium]